MRGERTTVLRVYESDAGCIANGLRIIREDSPHATTADVIRRMVAENKRMKTRIAYLNTIPWPKCNSMSGAS